MKRICAACFRRCLFVVWRAPRHGLRRRRRSAASLRMRPALYYRAWKSRQHRPRPATARSAVTNETGYYILQNLPTGPYRVEVTLPGFRTYVQTGIVLGANANPEINPVLEVGQVSETVEVQANVTQVEVRSLAIREVIETQQILDLPLNGEQRPT